MTTTRKPRRKLSFAKHFTLVGLSVPRKPRAHPLDCGYAITGRLCNCTCGYGRKLTPKRCRHPKVTVEQLRTCDGGLLTPKQKVLRRWPGLKCRYTSRWFCWAIDIPKSRLIALGRTPALAWADASSRLT